MKIRVAGFKGEVPRLHPRLLPEDAAQIAANTRLENGALVPMNGGALIETLGTAAQSIYLRRNGNWLSWPGIVKAADGPVNANRTYVTGNDEAPRVLGNLIAGQNYPLALPRPLTANRLSVTPLGVTDPDTAEATLFTYTFVTVLDEESQPCALSDSVVISPLQSVVFTNYPSAATINAMGRGINRLRFYRSQTDALGTTGLYFVKEVTVASLGASVTHNFTTEPLQELIATEDYDPPPAGLRGIVSAPNGIMAAFEGKDLYFSEPYRPHAWPIKYSLTTDFDIVGLASIGSAIVILTEGTPYIAQGTHPSSMVMEKIEQNLPCVSARGIVDLGYTVAYPSTEGLVTISTSGAQMVTGQVFTRQQWDELNAETFIAGQHIGRYIFSCIPAGEVARTTLILDLSGAQPYLIRSDEAIEATHFDIGTGRLFILIGGTQLREWDRLDQPPKTQTWRGKLNHLSTPTNFGCILVETDDYAGALSFEVDVIADGIVRRTITSAERNQIARLPSGFLALRWEVEFRGAATVTSISLATAPNELAVP